MMVWFGNEVSGWGYVVMAVSMLAFWGLFIVGVAAVVRYLGHGDPDAAPTGTPVPRSTPQEVLAHRFAAGKIEEQDYRQRLDGLPGGPRSTTRS